MKITLPSRKKVQLTMYQSVGFIGLMGTLTVMVFYLFLMFFFLFNSSWVSPTVLSQTDPHMLQFSAGYQTAFQNLETLKVMESQARRDVEVSKTAVAILTDLTDKVTKYNTRTTPLLNSDKTNDLHTSYSLLKDLDAVKTQTLQSLKAGLITSQEATQTFASIQQFHNITTDGNVSLGTTAITMESQTVQLKQLLAQAEDDAQTKAETLKAATASLEVASTTMNMLRQSMYYHAYETHGSNLVFLPYDNFDSAKVGSPIYECYFMVIGCSQVGTVVRVYEDEQSVDFPIFNVRFSRTVRGVFAEVKMTSKDSMRTQILFVGGKPLFL